jgi:hypothetical protein
VHIDFGVIVAFLTSRCLDDNQLCGGITFGAKFTVVLPSNCREISDLASACAAVNARL